MEAATTLKHPWKDDFELRSVGEWAFRLGIYCDTMFETRCALGKWRFQGPSNRTYGCDAHSIDLFLRSRGLLVKLDGVDNLIHVAGLSHSSGRKVRSA